MPFRCPGLHWRQIMEMRQGKWSFDRNAFSVGNVIAYVGQQAGYVGADAWHV